MTDHLATLIDALKTHQKRNRPPAIETPANPFEEVVNKHDELVSLLDKVKGLLKPIEAEERTLRDGIASSLNTFFADKLKEGTNNYALSNGRDLKYTYKVDRKITDSMIAVARAKFGTADDKPNEFTFDALLRVKYELEKKNWDKLPNGGQAQLAVSEMITAKPAAPTVVVD